MFKHGHYNEACMLFFPPNAAPPPPQPSMVGVATSSSSPQRPDPSATDYGTIDDLCELCVGYGAMSFLEEVVSTRMSSANPQDVAVNQYTAAALSRICIYCETHKHFNYLYEFQVNFFYALMTFYLSLSPNIHSTWAILIILQIPYMEILDFFF